jgi:O-antigen/teichoic acid export membrane protein
MSQSLTRSLPSLFLWQAVSVLTGFLTQIVLARSLGPHDKGILDLFLLIPVVAASVLDVGLLSANTYFAGKGIAPVRQLHSNTLIWSVVAGVVALTVSGGLLFFSTSIFPSLTGFQVVLAAVLVGPTLYASLWTGLMYGADQSLLVYRTTGLVSLISFLVYGASLLMNAEIETILFVSFALIILKAIVPLATTAHLTGLHPSLNRAIFNQSVKYGIALYVGLAVNTLHVRISQFLVGSHLGPAELGYFALAVRIAEMVWLLDFVVINASVFRITSSDLNESARITQQMTRMIGLMVITFSIFLGLVAPILIPVVFGAEFSPAVLPLLWLLPGIVGWSLARSVAQFIAYQMGRPWLNTQAASIAFFLNVALNMFLIPPFGISGAAISATVSYMCNFAILTFLFLKLAKVPLASTFLPQIEDVRLLREIVGQSLRPLFTKNR